MSQSLDYLKMTPGFHYAICFSLLRMNRQEKYLYARFEKRSRYYVIRLEQDLFGYWVITQINGQIKSRLGQTRTLALNDSRSV